MHSTRTADSSPASPCTQPAQHTGGMLPTRLESSPSARPLPRQPRPCHSWNLPYRGLGKKPHDRPSSSPAGTRLRPVVWMKCRGKQGTKQTQTCNSTVAMPFPGRYWVRRRSQEAPTQQSAGWHSKVIHVFRTSRSIRDPHYSIPCSCAGARSRPGATRGRLPHPPTAD